MTTLKSPVLEERTRPPRASFQSLVLLACLSVVALGMWASTALGVQTFYCNNCNLTTSYVSSGNQHWLQNNMSLFQAHKMRLQYSNGGGISILVAQFNAVYTPDASGSPLAQCRLLDSGSTLAQCWGTR